MSEWPTLDAFNSIMRERLYENKAEKGGDRAWVSGNNTSTGLRRTCDKNAEQLRDLFKLQDSVPSGLVSTSGMHKEIAGMIVKKCADIANMVMMIADYEQRLAPKKEPEPSDDIPF